MAVVLGTDYALVSGTMANPRICYQAHDATATASGSATGTDPAWVTDGETWSVWTSGGTGVQVLALDFGEALEIDYIGVAAHTVGTAGATIRPQFDAVGDGSWLSATDIPINSPTDDSALLWLFEPRTVFGVRLLMGIPTGASVNIAVAQAGQALELPRQSVFTGLPISESEQIRYRHMQSIRGDVIGRAVEGAELAFDVTIQNLAETFRTASGAPSWSGFKAHTKDTGPFFIAPKPAAYPDDVAYAQATERPRFERALPNKRVSGAVTLRCKGYLAP